MAQKTDKAATYNSYAEFEEKYYPNRESKKTMKHESPFKFGETIATESLSKLIERCKPVRR